MNKVNITEREVIVDTPKRFLRKEIRLKGGREIDWHYLNTPESVIVIPIIWNKQVLMLNQYRYNLKKRVIEFFSNHATTILTQGAVVVRKKSAALLGFTSLGAVFIGYRPHTLKSSFTYNFDVYAKKNLSIQISHKSLKFHPGPKNLSTVLKDSQNLQNLFFSHCR